ncbi:glutathione peroxidase [Spirochaetia bacterium]|nr:glutathione peroxidase [Spirochaetia bacterium]
MNTASKCGFTPQYKGLEELYQNYSEKGLVVIGFPCGQFMEQEYDSAGEIKEFCTLRYGVTFPLAQKGDVRDGTAQPLFRYLISQRGFKGLGKGLKAKMLTLILKKRYGASFGDDEIKWNFTKFLVNREGVVTGRYEPPVEPEKIAQDIEQLV